MGPTIYMEVYALYMTSHPRFLTSQHSIKFISLLYLISNWIYLTTHTLHLCIHTQIIDHISPIVHMITQAQYAWYHVNTDDITSTLYDITPCYDIHIHCIHVITPRIHVFTSTVPELLLTVLIRARLHYVWYQTTICMTSYEFYVISQTLLLTSKDCIHDITSTIFLNTEPTVYDITYTTLVTSQPL